MTKATLPDDAVLTCREIPLKAAADVKGLLHFRSGARETTKCLHIYRSSLCVLVGRVTGDVSHAIMKRLAVNCVHKARGSFDKLLLM
jgi:hypothetical protein